MEAQTVQQKAKKVSRLMEQRLQLRGKSLAVQARRGRRLLSRHLRDEAEYLSRAAELVENPKLMRMVDETRVNRAFAQLVDHLETVDPVNRRRGVMLGLLGSLSVNLFAVVGLVVAVLIWRGLL